MLKAVVSALVLATPAVGISAQSTQPPAPVSRPARPGRPVERQPAPGVFVRTDSPRAFETVSSAAGTVEMRLTAGRADVILDHPEPETEILVDMPGGQVSLLKDGFYTFNADTGITRVLHGEAIAYPGPGDTHGTKIKEAEQLTLAAPFHAVDADRFQLEADILPGFGPERQGDYAQGAYGDGPVYDGFGGYGPYGDGFYGGPVFAGGFGYPLAYGYPYGGFGYPFGVGIGFGYYGGGFGRFGGFRGGGFRR